MEGRGLVKESAGQQNTLRTQCREGVPSALDRVRQASQRNKAARFSALFHHVTQDRLRDAFMSIKRKASPGMLCAMTGAGNRRPSPSWGSPINAG